MKKISAGLTRAVFFAFLFVSILNFAGRAQTTGGTSADVNTFVFVTNFVDENFTVTGGGTITTATVRIASGFALGDGLSIDESSIPGGGFSSYFGESGLLVLIGSGTDAEWQASLRTVTFVANSMNGGTRRITISIGSVIRNPANNHFYEFINSGFSWTGAKADAELHSLAGMPGYLATITSQAENDFVFKSFRQYGWIGCTDDFLEINAATGTTTFNDQSESESNFYWVTGPEKGEQLSTGNNAPVIATYAHWYFNEPNNLGPENYGMIYGAYDGQWNDAENSTGQGYMLEYGGTGSDPTLEIDHSRNINVAPPTLSGDAGTPGSFSPDNNPYPVDVTMNFTNISIVTDVTVAITDGFKDLDMLEFDGGLLPSGVTGNYDAASGVLYFSGTATTTDWEPLLQSITFKTNSGSTGNRKITFTQGPYPAAANGHYYAIGANQISFAEVPDYFDNYEPNLRSYNGLTGYPVNINSANENYFIQKKIGAEFWMPLTDKFYYVNFIKGNNNLADQSASEGDFYWWSGLLKGTHVSSGDAPSVVAQPGQYNNWEASEPDNNGYEGDAAYYNPADGKWYDESLYDDFGNIMKAPLFEYGGKAGDPPFGLFFAKTMINLTALPVTLTKFEVKKENSSAVADWSTESELDFSYFRLERSIDSRSFVPIAKVAAKGTGSGRQDYRYTDTRPVVGFNYYRLKIVSNDSTFSYSPTRQVDFSGSRSNKVYPTIVTQQLHVELANPAGVRCQIFNQAGVLVRNINSVSGSFDIPVQSLAKGPYILSIIDVTGRKENWTFIRQ